jgi:hypothetical protein
MRTYKNFANEKINLYNRNYVRKRKGDNIMSITNTLTTGQCIVTVDQENGICRCGVEYTDRWGKTSRVDDITSDPEFLNEIIGTITSNDVSALHLRDIVEDMVIERYT